MLARVDDGTATAEDEAVLAEFEDVVRRLSDEDEDPQIKRAILDFARVELDRPGGDELRPRLRVVARGDEA